MTINSGEARSISHEPPQGTPTTQTTGSSDIRIDPVASLPRELWDKVLDYLSTADPNVIPPLMPVSKRWKRSVAGSACACPAFLLIPNESREEKNLRQALHFSRMSKLAGGQVRSVQAVLEVNPDCSEGQVEAIWGVLSTLLSEVKQLHLTWRRVQPPDGHLREPCRDSEDLTLVLEDDADCFDWCAYLLHSEAQALRSLDVVNGHISSPGRHRRHLQSLESLKYTIICDCQAVHSARASVSAFIAAAPRLKECCAEHEIGAQIAALGRTQMHSLREWSEYEASTLLDHFDAPALVDICLGAGWIEVIDRLSVAPQLTDCSRIEIANFRDMAMNKANIKRFFNALDTMPRIKTLHFELDANEPLAHQIFASSQMARASVARPR